MKERGRGRLTGLGLSLLLALVLYGHLPAGGSGLWGGGLAGPCFAQAESETTEEPAPEEIQWFREEMKISARYLEKDEGILGMSWTHFFTMLFLILFFIAAMTTLVMRHRRTKQLLDTLLKEESHGTDR